MKDRQCILHIRTATILELISNDEVEYVLKRGVKTFDFKHETESYTLALHYTFDLDNLEEIFAKAADWYRGYCAWEDNNIDIDEQSTNN